MINRSLVFILLVALLALVGYGQEPDAKKDNAPRSFAFAFDGEGGYLGVETKEVSKDNFAKLGLREVRGVAVEKVIENSPAAAAGLLAGDVIVRLDGEEITSTRKLTRLISEIAPDHRVKLTVVRGGSEQEITATLGKRQGFAFENGNFEFKTPGAQWTMPDMKDMPLFKNMPDMKDLPKLKDMPQLKDLPQDGTPFVWSFPGGEGKAMVWRGGMGRQIGVGVTPLTKQLAQHFGVDGGLMINEVREGSAAAKAGLKAGDIIIEADGKAIKGDFDLMRTINGKKDGDVTLQIVRDGKRQSIAVTPEVSKDGGFFWQNDDENGNVLTPAAPATPRPTIAPLPMKLLAPGRIM